MLYAVVTWKSAARAAAKKRGSPQRCLDSTTFAVTAMVDLEVIRSRDPLSGDVTFESVISCLILISI